MARPVTGAEPGTDGERPELLPSDDADLLLQQHGGDEHGDESGECQPEADRESQDGDGEAGEERQRQEDETTTGHPVAATREIGVATELLLDLTEDPLFVFG